MQTLSKWVFRPLILPYQSDAQNERSRRGLHNKNPSTQWKQNSLIWNSNHVDSRHVRKAYCVQQAQVWSTVLTRHIICDALPDALVRNAEICHFASSARNCASRRSFLHSADPDIHLLFRARNGLHRRLSQCSPAAPDSRRRSCGGDGGGTFHRQRGCSVTLSRVCRLFERKR